MIYYLSVLCGRQSFSKGALTPKRFLLKLIAHTQIHQWIKKCKAQRRLHRYRKTPDREETGRKKSKTEQSKKTMMAKVP